MQTAPTTDASDKPFVDFDQVWLAYNDELLAQNTFAVEDINLQVQQGDTGAMLHEQARRGLADAACAAGARDHGRAAFQQAAAARAGGKGGGGPIHG